MAPHPDDWHRPRVRHRQHLALLQQAEQIAGLRAASEKGASGSLREARRAACRSGSGAE
jgi:hypothetical protein